MARLTHDEAVERLQRNRIRVETVRDKESGAVIAKIIKVTRPVGLKIITAIDCLINYHNYKRA